MTELQTKTMDVDDPIRHELVGSDARPKNSAALIFLTRVVFSAIVKWNLITLTFVLVNSD